MIPDLAPDCPPDDVENYVIINRLTCDSDNTGALLEFEIMSDYGNLYYGLVCDNFVSEIFYVPDGGGSYSKRLAFATDKTAHAFSVVPNGLNADAYDIDLARQQQYYTEDKGKNVEIDFDTIIETCEARGDNNQISNLIITGAKRWSNIRTTNIATQGELDLVLFNVGTIRTARLQLNDTILAEGQRAGDGVMTLLPLNESGISATLTVAYSAPLSLGTAFAMIRWAKRYEIHCAPVLVFPRTPEATVVDTGLGNHLRADLIVETTGVHSIVIRAVSDTGIANSSAVVQKTVAIPGRPEPPSELVYQSGAATATIIKFKKSVTVGATYLYYDSESNHPTDYSVPVTVTELDNGDGTISATLPAYPLGAGIRRVNVSAVFGGTEDGERKTLKIEYDALGVVIFPRPNVPSFVLRSRNV